jgi:hypothetical protein
MLDLSNKAAPTAVEHFPSFSDIELCAHWTICPRTSLNRRRSGKMPPHFLKGKQVRYLVSDIEAYEKLNA